MAEWARGGAVEGLARRRLSALLAAFALVGCSGSIEFGQPRQPVIVGAPGGGSAVVEPNGDIIEQPPIQTVITGLQQAQQTRTLVKALSR